MTNKAAHPSAMHWLPRASIALATILMLVGLLLHVATGKSVVSETLSVQLLHANLTAQLIGAGILLLLLTPVLRICIQLVLWMRARDWRYASVALLILALLGGTIIREYF